MVSDTTIAWLDTMGLCVSIAILAFLVFLLVLVARTIIRWKAYHLWSFYILTVVGFGCIYRYCNSVDGDGAHLPTGWSLDNTTLELYFDPRAQEGGSDHANTSELAGEERVFLLFMYFSMTTQTSVGYGDIVPESVVLRVVASFQMFLGLAYGSMLVGLTMESDMQLLLNSQHSKLTKQLKRLVDWKAREAARERFVLRRREFEAAMERERQELGAGGGDGSGRRCRRCCRRGHQTCLALCVGCCCDYDEKCTCFFVRKIIQNTIVARVRRFLRYWLLTFTMFVVLLFNALVARATDDDDAEDGAGKAVKGVLPSSTFVVGLCIHAILLVIIVGTSMKFVRKTESVTVQFLCKAFLATCALFGSLYNLLALFEPHSFTHTDVLLENLIRSAKNPHIRYAYVLFQTFGRQFATFMYYSITTMTTTGFGFVTPQSSSAQCVVMIQELMSVLFAQIVLGVGIQSVAVKMEMKKDPGKFALLDTSTMEENIRVLLRGREPESSSSGGDFHAGKYGDATADGGKEQAGGLDGGDRHSLRPRMDEDKLSNLPPRESSTRAPSEGEGIGLPPLYSSVHHERTPSGRERSSSLVVSDLMLRISELEHAMERSGGSAPRRPPKKTR